VAVAIPAAAALLRLQAPQAPDPDKVSPGLIGFLTMFALALATILLVRSMVRHLRKVRYSTPPDDGAAGPPETGPHPRDDEADPGRSSLERPRPDDSP
jgi:hypothetical protein